MRCGRVCSREPGLRGLREEGGWARANFELGKSDVLWREEGGEGSILSRSEAAEAARWKMRRGSRCVWVTCVR